MGCWHPIEMKTETQKKFGFKGQIVPCGRCLGCLSKKRRDWCFRLLQELKSASSASFLTLTYEDESLPGGLVKNDLQKYFKRVRKESKNLKYYAVGEYGEKTNRPHYHAIVFNCDPDCLADKWDMGISHQGTVTDESIKYVTKYLINEEYIDNPIKPFAIMSKGLGKIYLKNATKFHKSNFTDIVGGEPGNESHIPRYYREAIFTKAERELLRQDNQVGKVCLSYGKPESELEIKKRRVKRKVSKQKSKSKNL